MDENSIDNLKSARLRLNLTYLVKIRETHSIFAWLASRCGMRITGWAWKGRSFSNRKGGCTRIGWWVMIQGKTWQSSLSLLIRECRGDRGPSVAFSSTGYIAGCFLWKFQKKTSVVSLGEYVVCVGTLAIPHYWKDAHWITSKIKCNFPSVGNDRRFSSSDQLFIDWMPVQIITNAF